MPPRAPAHDDHVVEDDNKYATKSTETTTTNNGSSSASSSRRGGKAQPLPSMQKHPGKVLKNTFHWELNLYSFAFLGFLYYLTTPRWQAFWQGAAVLIAADAARYYYAKGRMAGVPYTLPFVSLLAMIVHPTRFWAEMADIAIASPEGLCSNQLVGNHMVFVTDPDRCREVMTGEGVYGVYAHPNAMWLFGPKNLIYLEKDRHKKFRAILTPALFGKESLRQYAKIQERVVRSSLSKIGNECAAKDEPFDAQVGFRAMAALASQESFLGPYLTPALTEQLERDILEFTMGFLCFPFPYLNTGLARAIAAKHRIETAVREIVPKARKYVEAGNEPRCMIEHWLLSIVNASKEQGLASSQDVDCCHDDDMARATLDMIFAAQDATNSALTYSLDVLEAHPDVFEKMRAEVEEITKDGSTIWESKNAEKFVYIGKVANQMLHHKPPVPMIPHIAKMNCVLGGHAIGKGTVVIPSITYSARVSGASLEFLPERPDDDHMFVKTVTFGAGQHKCPGRRYAESLLTVFLAVLAQDYDISRVKGARRPTADEFFYFPTLFPDDSNFYVTPRK